MAEVLPLAGNPSSLHASGRRARRLLEEARESLAADLGAHPSEVVFTSGGTEANNLALLGGVDADRPRAAISSVEHPSVGAVRSGSTWFGCRWNPPAISGSRLSWVAGRPHRRDVGDVGEQRPERCSRYERSSNWRGLRVRSRTATRCRRSATCRSTCASGLDLLTVSAHKLGGPVGIGALVVRRGVRLRPVGFGGGQEARLRSFDPVALAVGFATAAGRAVERLDDESTRLAGLRDLLIAGALAAS